MSFVETVEPASAQGDLGHLYQRLQSNRGKIAAVHKAQSLNPKVLAQHMELYMATMFAPSSLSRAQREMLAVVVSTVNDCHYCLTHHALALNNFWKDDSRIELLRKQRFSDCLDMGDRLLCQLAIALTMTPSGIAEQDHIQPLREAGLSDQVIVDAVGVIAYFNYANRIVLGLGVKIEEDGGGGYRY